jgi:hypothetical protein
MYRDDQHVGKALASFRQTGHSRVYLVSSGDNLEARGRNSPRHLGDAPRGLGDRMVGVYGSSLGGSRPLRDLVALLSLEGTKRRIAGSPRLP